MKSHSRQMLSCSRIPYYTFCRKNIESNFSGGKVLKILDIQRSIADLILIIEMSQRQNKPHSTEPSYETADLTKVISLLQCCRALKSDSKVANRATVAAS
ncbi:hypothetical protein C7B69_07085 [filamentous cyanobacterium Phorm 46]|nr:hypothetical protein C7B69_07085 [filamentous cyanobacterium Phorm 46]